MKRQIKRQKMSEVRLKEREGKPNKESRFYVDYFVPKPFSKYRLVGGR